MEGTPPPQASSVFPAPPSSYLFHTPENFALLSTLRSKIGPLPASLPSLEEQRKIVENDNLDTGLEMLEPPRVDWIEEFEDGFETFGAFYPIAYGIPTVEEMGIPRLIPKDIQDQRPYLLTLLRTFLTTYTSLLFALTRPPPPLPTQEGEMPEIVAKPYVDKMAEIGVNMICGVNELREVQARATLELLMTEQLNRRREETAKIKQKCADLTRSLSLLRSKSLSSSAFSMAPLRTENSQSAENTEQQKSISIIKALESI